ncbi:MAG: response regulator transcription factor [Oscillospiraceae bacterium]|nr:response regulator transcription factor [Oscillospiraceae bacterium]MBP5361761.1 response regulator transcription factor [Ruminococcus sp.]
MKLLVAEDDAKLLKSLVHILECNFFTAEGVTNGTDALEYAQTNHYDGIILDIMMPGLDGLEVLRRLRSSGVSTPAMFLTARTEVYQRVEGLDAGADDYLAKPFAPAELIARVRAMLRRKDNFVPDLLQYGDLTLNRSTYEISCSESVQTLSAKEFQIIEILMEHHGAIITTDQLMSKVWGWDSDVDTSVVWVHISNLRKKINTIGASCEIRFVRNAGYLLEGLQ